MLSILGTIGGMLAVIGIAMNMKAIFRGNARVFLFVGFFMTVYFNLNLIAISILGIIFAVVYAQSFQKGESK